MNDMKDLLTNMAGAGLLATEPQAEQQIEPPQPQAEEPQEAIEPTIVEEAPPIKEEEQPQIVDEEPEVVVAEEVSIDFTPLKEMGIEAKDWDDVKSHIETLKQEAQQYKAQADTRFANDKVKAINDFVANGGDVDAFVSSEKEISELEGYKENLKTVSPADAYRVYLKNQLGNDEEVEDFMNSLTDVEIKLRGIDVIKNEERVTDQIIGSKRQAVEQMAEQQKQKTERSRDMIAEAVKKVEVINGVKLPQKEVAVLSKFNSPADIIREVFPLDKDGLPIADVWARNLAQVKLGKRASEVLRQKVGNSTKKEVFDKLQNVPTSLQQQHEKPRERSESATTQDIQQLTQVLRGNY